jgi:NAD-dependent dihydropyrimidine dehydrogenase PreA subunit
MKDGKSVYKGDGCIECGACVQACPVEAMSL